MNSVKKAKKAKNTKAQSKRFTPYKCELCPKKFTERSGLVSHLHTHSDDKPYPCPLCDYAGKTQKYLSRHIKVTHDRVRNFECDVCGKAFHYECKLKDHKRVHTGEKPYKCGDCDKAFNSSYSLNTHKLIHANLKPFRCPYCEYACRDSSTLRKHKERHEDRVKYYTCSVCNKSCPTKSVLKVHIAEKHFDIDVRKFECDACGKRFKFKEALVRHIQVVHEKAFQAKCEICGKMIMNKNNMVSHMRTHIDQRPFLCTFEGCGRRFKDKSTRRKHVMTHYPDRQFQCKICERKFAREERMRKHLKTHMAKVKKVECNYCGVRFYNKNYLTTHIQRKHGRKKQKYICDLCDFKTTNKPSIVMHIKYGHGEQKKLICAICEKIFKRDFNMKLHYWMAHEMEYDIPTRKRKCKKSENTASCTVQVKEEPLDTVYDGKDFFEVTPKIEPLDDEGLGELVNIEVPPEARPELEDFPQEAFEEFITPVVRSHGDRRDKRHTLYKKINQFESRQLETFPYPNDNSVDQKTEARVKKKLNVLIEKTKEKVARREQEEKEKMASEALERTRRKYNKLMRKALEKSLKKAKVKIKHGGISANEQCSNPLLVEDFAITQTIDSTDCIVDENIDTIDKQRKDIEDEGTENNSIIEEGKNESKEKEQAEADVDQIKENQIDCKEKRRREVSKTICYEDECTDMDEDSKDDTKDEDFVIDDVAKTQKHGKEDTNLGQNRKIQFNTHQCYVCFKLYETKEKLLDHCKEHFNLTNMQTLKKCPLCDYTTNLSITKHLKQKHDIVVKVPYGKFKDDKSRDGSRYYYEVNDEIIKTVDIVPSVRNLNKIASCKIDKIKRDKKNKDVLKRKLVKKGKEWIVMEEKLKINYKDCLLPKFDKLEGANVKGGYCDKLKELYKVAKKEGKKMLFPCDGCDKICQTLAALKLHERKHQKNPTPFKPKVWKHKIKDNINDKKTNKTRNINTANRTAKPKPVVNKHKCEKELIEFYEQNIKGSDVEFWQFLKIYNKMGRENVNDFEDLQKSSHFGLHCNEPQEINEANSSCGVANTSVSSANIDRDNDNSVRASTVVRAPVENVKKTAKNAFTRVVMLSKKELMRRNKAKERLRMKIKHNTNT